MAARIRGGVSCFNVAGLLAPRDTLSLPISGENTRSIRQKLQCREETAEKEAESM